LKKRCAIDDETQAEKKSHFGPFAYWHLYPKNRGGKVIKKFQGEKIEGEGYH